MALTRAAVESLLLRRVGGKMAVVGMDNATQDGNNADLNEPICTALLQIGQAFPSDVANIVDADLPGTDYLTELLDRAELQVMKNIAGNIALVDIAVGPRRESLNQLASQVEAAITRLEESIQTRYADLGKTLQAGTISLDFAREDENNDTILL